MRPVDIVCIVEPSVYIADMEGLRVVNRNKHRSAVGLSNRFSRLLLLHLSHGLGENHEKMLSSTVKYHFVSSLYEAFLACFFATVSQIPYCSFKHRNYVRVSIRDLLDSLKLLR